MSAAEIRENEMSTMSAREVSEHIARLIKGVVKLGLPGNYLPAIMLWGPPGVGKSDAIKQAAVSVERSAGKKVVITDVRLLLYNPVDLRGIPVADAQKQFAIWLKPKVFMMDSGEDVVNILFLDELTAAPQSVQAAAYQITLDRMVGEHRLPENCFVIAAGNRVTDRSVSFKMPKALANRLCHIEVEADFAAWREWAMEHDIDPMVLGFLHYDPESLMKFGSVDSEVAFPTPRSWEMVSNILKIYGSIEEAIPFISGCVGKAAATSLMTWSKVWNQLPSIDDIFAGKAVKLPTRPDLIYALISAMLIYARRKTTTIDQIKNSITCASRIPADYAMVLFKGYFNLEGKCEGDIKNELIKNNEFRQWLNKNGRYMSE